MSLILSVLFISCKDSKEHEINRIENDTTETSVDSNIKPDTTGINKSLQGIWREREYPFRQIHFEKNQMKFIEEGVVEEPRFKEFKISRECPFDVKNIVSTSPEDIFLVMVEDESCENLKIENNILNLSGYNFSSQSDYTMAFERVEK